MQFWSLEELAKQELAVHEIGQEVAPGVTITRRGLLQLGVVGLAGVLAPGCSSPRHSLVEADLSTSTPLSIEGLVAKLRPEARQMLAAEQADEEAYLRLATQLLDAYEPEEPWALREPRDGGFSMNRVAWMAPVLVFSIHMRPGSKLPLHDHRHYNGVLYCEEGSVRCRNFDIVQPDGAPLDIAAGEVPPQGEDFLIRENADLTFGPGKYSTLTRDRDNIHDVEAGPDGCVLTDLFTYFRPEARSYGLDWDGEPLEQGGNVYRAAWKS